MVSGPTQGKPAIMVWARSSLNSTMSYNQDHGFGSSASSRTFMIAKFALRFSDRNRTSGSMGVVFVQVWMIHISLKPWDMRICPIRKVDKAGPIIFDYVCKRV